MSPLHHCHVEGGKHVVCATTNGLDHVRVQRPPFDKPRQAIDFARMRDANVQPLRASAEISTARVFEVSAESPRGDSSGAQPA